MPGPVAWLLIQAAEVFVLIPVLLFWVPDRWPRGVRIALWCVVVIAIVAGNLVFLRSRRMAATREEEDARRPDATR
jgi:hypothetical protein